MFIPTEGPTQYKFKDPDTGYLYHAASKQALILRITQYREQNCLEFLPNLSLVIDNYLCSLPENNGKCMDAELQRSWMSYLKGGVALLINVFYKDQVTDEVAESRAKQCSLCPNNIFPDKGGFIAWSDEIAERSTGGRTTSQNHLLGSCSCCTCPLKAKVFQGGVIDVTPEERLEMEKVDCWQIKST